MATKPFTPCNKIGCGELTRERYCEEHKLAASDTHRYYDRFVRDKNTKSFYHSKAWIKVRKVVIARDNGLCQQCLSSQRITVGTIVDHIIPLKQDWRKRLDLDNLQLLCQTCHNQKTAKEKVGF